MEEIKDSFNSKEEPNFSYELPKNDSPLLDMGDFETLESSLHASSEFAGDRNSEKDAFDESFETLSGLASTTRPLVTSNEELIETGKSASPSIAGANLLDYVNVEQSSSLIDIGADTRVEDSFRDPVSEPQQRSVGDQLLIDESSQFADESKRLISAIESKDFSPASFNKVHESELVETLPKIKDPKIEAKPKVESDNYESGYPAYEPAAQPVKSEVAMEAEKVGNATENKDECECPFSPGFLGKSVKLLSEMTEKYPQNVEIKNLFAVSYLMIGQNKEAKKVLYDVLKVKPDSGFAKVHLGFILKTEDSKYKEAARLLSEGIATREEGVIDGRFYFHLGDALHRTGKQDEAMAVYKEAVKEGLFLSEYQRSLYNVNGLTGKPWWDPMSTVYAPYFKILEKKWMAIRDEALSLTNEKHSGFLPETEGLQDTGDWKQFELFARGRKIEKNCVKAPITCSLLSQFPDAVNCKRGQVKFSIMQPSTHVWAHTGPTNCRLRSHLGLVVPDGTSIRVANELRTWEEGKVILFDDSFEHEVWHNGTAPRLVLIADFWHPELTAYQKKNLTPI
ncbi:hypothetical protein CDAR_103141 [Caerostris darwini]|uniref:Aspartyl/asparaginy/proline hydroxylase domain-containing protein n=1 Tax=Caerostris darwini TaxID=1538125 RepID=A0AAV4V3W7_9ARAC|nr:hypothetical protein CDAR_103141 [Caerostris darwini]